MRRIGPHALASWTHGAVDIAVDHFVLIVAALAVVCYVGIYTRSDAPAPIRSDGFSYYVYVPSWLIYGDATLEAPARDWYGGTYPPYTAIMRWPGTGRWVNPHPIGPAVLMIPFFAVAHLLTRWSNLPPDGFSLYYQHAAGLAGLAYFLLGLSVLRALLCRHFSNGIALATLTAITWGTNLFHYGVYDSGFSHAYGFFLVSVLVALTERWWEAPTLFRTTGLGLTAAMLVLTRHTNALFLLMLPLYGPIGRDAIRQRAGDLWRRRGSLAVMALVAALGVLPQLAMYRWATHSWWASPYGALDVGFHVGSPHLVGVLFGTEKGLFFWSPVLLLAVAGLVTARGWARGLVLPTVVIGGIETYLIASWSDWQFGGSYGHRGFTDGLGLLAVFLAAFFAWTARDERRIRPVAAVTAAAVFLSVAQMAQYWLGVLPIANTTWAQYRAGFLRFP